MLGASRAPRKLLAKTSRRRITSRERRAAALSPLIVSLHNFWLLAFAEFLINFQRAH